MYPWAFPDGPTNLRVEPSYVALVSNEVLSLGMTCHHNSFFLLIINFILSFNVVYAYSKVLKKWK